MSSFQEQIIVAIIGAVINGVLIPFGFGIGKLIVHIIKTMWEGEVRVGVLQKGIEQQTRLLQDTLHHNNRLEIEQQAHQLAEQIIKERQK